MGSEEEYQKRLKILHNITNQIKHCVETVVVGGSVGYHNVENHCDIDTVVVVDMANIDNLLSTDYFQGTVQKEVLDLFKKKLINFFWVSKKVGGIDVDVFIYDKEAYEKNCLLDGNRIGFINKKVSSKNYGFGFTGQKIEYDRKVKSFKGGCIYETPPFAKGIYIGQVPRDDFLFLGYVAFQKDNYFTNLQEKVWNKLTLQLIEECGKDVDLTKQNILNSIFVYNWQKELKKTLLSDEILERIKKRTREEVAKIISS